MRLAIHMSTQRRRRPDRQRGALLGIVLILMVVVVGAAAIALWGLRSDIGAAGKDRLARQLFDCAEQGLAKGKNFFAVTARGSWNNYLAADVCASGKLPCVPSGPFPTGNSGSVTNYPAGAPYTTTIEPTGVLSTFSYTFGLYNVISASPLGTDVSRTADNDTYAVVYSVCTDTASGQSRAVQAVISSTAPLSSGDYTGQAGHGFRNANNAN